ncbi:Piso0_002070 [Millerozyma farinosa CBS 7064]|uniref:Piso0_002070 protein n=1 Tax=Pichia sorbitophila (strain ATCC MYA-4447 / BCRC 22081 / CBS 7064 / NBRC 10061 / NRRL Y-12695) TaxID=559304 RepID=G8YE15_PICSO|nr:Piso0_002070 [Millerozyma farinosa CBS 7064]
MIESASAPGVQRLTNSGSNQRTAIPLPLRRDVIALLFILLALPQSVLCLVMGAYLIHEKQSLSSCSSFFNRLNTIRVRDVRDRHERQSALRREMRFLVRILFNIVQNMSLGTLTTIAVILMTPSRLGKYLVLLANSVVASEIIGLLDSNHHGISNNLSSTVKKDEVPNSEHYSGRYFLDGRFSSSSLWDICISFSVVLYLNHIIRVLSSDIDLQSFSQIRTNISDWVHVIYASPDIIFKSEFFKTIPTLFFNPSYPFLLTKHILKNSKYFVEASMIDEFFARDETNASSLAHIGSIKSALYLCSQLKFHRAACVFVSESFYLISQILSVLCTLLSIRIVLCAGFPIIQNSFSKKNQADTLEDLTLFGTPINIEEYKKLKVKDAGSSSNNNIPVVSVQDNAHEATSSSEITTSELATIELPNNLPDVSSSSYSSERLKDSRVAKENFKQFCNFLVRSRATKKEDNLFLKPMKAIAPPNVLVHHQPTSRNSGSASRGSTVSTIVKDTKVDINRPLWQYLAAQKIFWKNPLLFAGRDEKIPNNDDRQVVRHCNIHEPMLAIIYIDDSKVIFKILDEALSRRISSDEHIRELRVSVNGVNWIFMDIYKSKENAGSYLCIYGLTPLYQYDILVFESGTSHDILFHAKINTISSSSDTILSKSQETTTLLTLKFSLQATLENIENFKAKLRRLKKEENRRVAEVKKDIASVKGKTSKYSNKKVRNGRASGKLKGLQHSVSQLENEVNELKRKLFDLDEANKNDVKLYQEREEKLNDQIKVLEAFVDENERYVGEYRSKSKKLEQEEQQLLIRKDKTIQRELLRKEEMSKLANDLKNLKKSHIIGKILKRNKKLQDRFSLIIPNIEQNTLNLKKIASYLQNDLES